MIYLGIDTSNYTTSVAAAGNDMLISKRQILPVKAGERGIRQSDGVFQHMKLLPELFDALSNEADMKKIAAVGVSTRPRNIEGSYMPVFLTGEGYARVIADALDVPLYKFSHQDGHIMAGIYSCGCENLLSGEFLSVHLSGGTTEILKTCFVGNGFENEIIGGTKDISAGQFIDRIGVKLGLQFPAGKGLEVLSKNAKKAIKLPISTDGAYMNFSGIETKASRMAGECDSSELALGVLTAVKNALVKTLKCAMENTGIKRVLLVGGVASNGLIRNGLTNELDGDIYFASPELSTDNAVGIAKLAEIQER
jgi:N6-L-threonylcarbamoyladenine synthase